MFNWRYESDFIGRYLGSGAINTMLGFAVIFSMTALDISPYLANIAGYITGLVLGFWLSRLFVFRSNGRVNREVRRFAFAFGISWLLNFFILWFSMDTFNIQPMLAQLIAAVGYSMSMYLLGRLYVFSPS